jgi:hypothetical protein
MPRPGVEPETLGTRGERSIVAPPKWTVWHCLEANYMICMQVVYIAPLKALVRERMEDWKVRIEQKLGKKWVPVFTDYTHTYSHTHTSVLWLFSMSE